MGQPAVADCVEACLREALMLALYDGRGGYSVRLLPPSTDSELVNFFAADGPCTSADAGRRWFDLLSARPGLSYMLGCGERRYELFPSVKNFGATLESLLGVPVSLPPRLDDDVLVWPNSPLRWQQLGCERHPILLLQRSSKGDVTSGHGLHVSCGRAAEAQGVDEAMRIVFNGQRHCYSLRDATVTEPAWIGRVRHAWKRRLHEQRMQLAPGLDAAAARLLQLRGPCDMARHEALHMAMP